jgi:hypothetical protein
MGIPDIIGDDIPNRPNAVRLTNRAPAVKDDFRVLCEMALAVAAVLIAYGMMFREIFISLFG